MRDFCVIIPAVKKNVAFTDDLVRKLGGRSLIQRAIDKALELASARDVYVVTDSEEIRLVAERSATQSFFDPRLRFSGPDLVPQLKGFLATMSGGYRDLMVIHPYAPLVSSGKIRDAYAKFRAGGSDVLLAVKEERHRVFRTTDTSLRDLMHDDRMQRVFTEIRAFQIMKATVARGQVRQPRLSPYFLDDDAIEIASYRDWWICEKLLFRKRIVFRVIGNSTVGMGHIFRALTMAHEITDHEVIFVCDKDSRMAAVKLASYDYRLEVFSRGAITAGIIALAPDLVVNDMLATDTAYMRRLQSRGIPVANFEDLGPGAAVADIVINELYDYPVIDGTNILWGHPYFFVRDEFESATPHRFRQKVGALLITFGGTDSSDFTRKTLAVVAKYCAAQGIRIYIVTGEGYAHRTAIERLLAAPGYTHVEYTFATGVMSSIMEKTDIAICSNGRTVYELARMNIPSIILAHHARENTHRFACAENGFVNLGLYRAGKTEKQVGIALARLVEDNAHRRELFDRVRRFQFRGNKQKVLRLLLGLLK
jgi:spore coat polysaccharide biosynthesis predicted glycosyltransferase SpsG/CMP-N-acetylneuraminic acid synthetase